MQFNFVLGVFGCTPATADNLAWLVKNIPADATWTATGIGRHEFPLAAAAIGMGGHVRVGFEDNLYLSKGVLAKSNGELVAKAARIAHELGREIANPAEARQILSLAPRNKKDIDSPPPLFTNTITQSIISTFICRRKETSMARTVSSLLRAYYHSPQTRSTTIWMRSTTTRSSSMYRR